MLLYVSGPHGAGKTTLINGLLQYDSFHKAYSYDCHIPDRTAYERASIRITKYLLEQQENIRRSKETDKIILADRGIYDTLCYIDAYLSLGWISKEQHQTLIEHINNLFFIYTRKKRDKVILLIPNIENLSLRLRKRSFDGDTRWMQENEHFSQILHDCYLTRFITLEKLNIIKVIWLINNASVMENIVYLRDELSKNNKDNNESK
ncbi:Thymidylate kinase [Pectobacterium brasiliense]|uniref:AAA family ATPase n=1 Tax=Pectobacterium brasiliense TaxID=180957 RepID=UPI000CE68BA6|nr:AAA family ATPase [Pectobacterium brasiliense]PPE61537.1 Thymidylate kinase [Pectobacterium brasiliense]